MHLTQVVVWYNNRILTCIHVINEHGNSVTLCYAIATLQHCQPHAMLAAVSPERSVTANYATLELVTVGHTTCVPSTVLLLRQQQSVCVCASEKCVCMWGVLEGSTHMRHKYSL